MKNLEVFFNPRSIAIIGASNNPNKPPYYIVKNLVDFGYEGKIFPINPRESKIYNIPAYPSILDLKDDEIDLAFIILPSEITPKIIEECGKKGVKGVIIGSGRFSEIGEEGKKNISEVLKIANKYNIRIMGPNSIGVTNPPNFTTAFIDIKMPQKGNIAIITQTGSIGGPLLHWLMPISKTISLGNKADIGIHEILEYLETDPETKFIGIHCEQINNIDKFKTVAKRVNQKKPIVILKTGTSKIGTEVAKSHTASISGKDEIYNALFKQIRLIRVFNFEEFFDTLRMIDKKDFLKNGNLGLVSISGAQAVLTCDICEKLDIPIAKLSKNSPDEIKKFAINNLVLLDVGSWQGEMIIGDIFKHLTELALSEPNVNYIIIFMIPTPKLFYFDVPNIFSNLQSKFNNKLLLMCMIGDEDICLKWKKELELNGLNTFSSISRALRCIAYLRS